MEDSNKKWYLFGGLAIVVVGLVVFLLVSVFRPSGPAPTASGSVPVVIPDGDVASLEDSKSKVYRGSTESYFEQLSAAGDEEISLVSDSLHTSRPSVPVSGAPAPSGGASSVERVFGSPAPSAEGPAALATGGGSAPRPMSADEKLEYDRKRAEMVRDVLTGGQEEPRRSAQGDSKSERSEESPAAAIDLSAVGSSEGIISYLDDEPSEGVGYGVRPFRCMFVRDQKIKSGQRVTVRLLKDYADGSVRIPANTHLQAICKIGDRLELSVRSLELNGRILPLALDAYDTDGLPGIYCPETSAAKNARKASDDAIATAGRTFGGLVGDLANTVLRTGATIAKSATGEVSVSVVSGYEFYLVKNERR
jgi:hypothetical protein